jgi:hypothetical protein
VEGFAVLRRGHRAAACFAFRYLHTVQLLLRLLQVRNAEAAFAHVAEMVLLKLVLLYPRQAPELPAACWRLVR